MKGVLSQGERGVLSSAEILQTRSEEGFSEYMGVRTFGTKSIGFFGIYGVFARTRGRGLSQCRYFVDKVGGS